MTAFITAISLLPRAQTVRVSSPRRPRPAFNRPASVRTRICATASAEKPATQAAPLEQVEHAATDDLVQSLQEMPFPPSAAVIEQMVRHLADSRGMLRLALVDNFGRIGSSAVPSLTHALQTSPNPVIRRSAGKALAKIGDSSATPVLLRVLVYDPDTVTRSSAAGALAKMGPSAVPPLLALIADPDVSMTAKGHAAWAIAYMRGGEATAKALFDAAGSSSDDVRLAVVNALGTVAIGDSLPVMGASNSSVDSADDWDSQEEGDIDPETKSRALATLRLMLNNDSNTEVRAEAATALGNAGSVEDAPTIAQLLQDSDPELRRCAALSLMKLGDTSYAPVLRQKADDETESSDVRGVAALAARTLEAAAERDEDDDW